jgi:hypothetical protein
LDFTCKLCGCVHASYCAHLMVIVCNRRRWKRIEGHHQVVFFYDKFVIIIYIVRLFMLPT